MHRPEHLILRAELPGPSRGDYADPEPPDGPTLADFCTACGEERGCDLQLVDGLCPPCLDLRENPVACTRCGAEAGAFAPAGRVVLDDGVCEWCRAMERIGRPGSGNRRQHEELP